MIECSSCNGTGFTGFARTFDETCGCCFGTGEIQKSYGGNAMKYTDELVAENKSLHAKIDLLESRLGTYQVMCSDAWARVNRIRAEYNIAKEALENIAEHSFIPPANFVDVASDALYRIGQMEAEKK